MENILITGVAGFIGFHLWQKLNNENSVVGIDNLAKFSNYNIKLRRLEQLNFDTTKFSMPSNYTAKNFNFWYADLNNTSLIKKILKDNKIDLVVHLAAATGVRQSITHPEIYTEANILGFNNLIEAMHQTGVNNLIYASSSSVYGNDTSIPFKENAPCNNPLSYYAVTKKKQRTYCTKLRFKLRYEYNRIAFFYSVWSLGQTRYGKLQVYRCYNEKRTF
ncbi:MAG: NAD-dependent epimerase/dehydratase family protein [Chitinophagales bacterium]